MICSRQQVSLRHPFKFSQKKKKKERKKERRTKPGHPEMIKAARN